MANCTLAADEDTLEIHWTGDASLAGDLDGFDVALTLDAFAVELAHVIVLEYPEATVVVNLIEGWGSEPEITSTTLPEPAVDPAPSAELLEAEAFVARAAQETLTGRTWLRGHREEADT